MKLNDWENDSSGKREAWGGSIRQVFFFGFGHALPPIITRKSWREPSNEPRSRNRSRGSIACGASDRFGTVGAMSEKNPVPRVDSSPATVFR